MLVGRVCEIRNEPVAAFASVSPPSFHRPTGAALTSTTASVLPCGCNAVSVAFHATSAPPGAVVAKPKYILRRGPLASSAVTLMSVGAPY
eukprot:7094237-Prymnesium_polylepis.2